MPEAWFGDDYADLRRDCGVPEVLTFKTRIELALEMINRTVESGLSPAHWIGRDTFFSVSGIIKISSEDDFYEIISNRYNTNRLCPQEGILCAWAILTGGEKVLLHMDLGNKESHACWLEFLRNMVQRGLPIPLSITTDGAPGLMNAVEEIWPLSLRIRCWVHKMRNVLDKVPEAHKKEVRAFLTAVRDAPDYETGKQRANEFKEKYETQYPRAVNSFYEDLEATLNHLKMPAVHHKYIRTTNLIERSFEKEKRRSKVIPRYFDEKSALKLAYATLWRASQRWRKVRFTEVEQKMIMEWRKK